MAIEDSAVLAKIFGHLSSVDQISSFQYAFQERRTARTKKIRENEVGNIYFMAMPNDAGATHRDQHFRNRRDKNLSPLEDESGDASGLWESIKETWCYDAEDEADDWWVGWGMLRLRSLKGEVKFGMEVQVSIYFPPLITTIALLIRFPECSNEYTVDRPIITFSRGVSVQTGQYTMSFITVFFFISTCCLCT